MFKNLYTPEWFKIINPYGLIDKLLTLFRVLLSPLFRITNSTYSFNTSVVRKGYVLVEFKESDVLYVKDKLIAGTDEIPEDFVYRVTNITQELEMIGCTYTDNIAIKNMDYVIRNGVYWFKEHPSKFCYTFFDNSEPSYNTIGFSNDCMKVPKGFTSITSYSTSFSTSTIYDVVIKNGLQGALNTLYLAYQGIYTSAGVHGKFIYTWKEGSRIFGITDTHTFITSPTLDKVAINYMDNFKIDSTPDYFLVDLDNVYYPVNFAVNDSKYYPDIQRTYPSLKIYNNMFLGSDLYTILKNTGCNFTEIAYIDKCDIDNNLLINSMRTGVVLLYLGVIDIVVPDEEVVDTQDTTVNSYNYSDNMIIDIKYIF